MKNGIGKLFCLAFTATLALAQPVSPEWLKSGVIYEINPRTFSSTGNFKGIQQRLPYLQQLGVTVLWIMPIHPVGKEKSKGTLGSAYSVQDYYGINPAYGSADDFRALVRESHRLGFKVIIDIVANHTAWDSVLMKHPEYYKHAPDGKIIPPEPDWSDVAALNYKNAELRQYMLKMLEYWLREFELDGFRCDVASQVPADFWNQARASLAKIKPDLMMLAEAHEPVLLEKAFDLDYSWPLHGKLTEVFEFGVRASALHDEWLQERKIYPQGAMHLRFSDNHDEKRAIARFGERGALAASALMFTLDGVPLLYNGMEIGDTSESGAPALFERLPVFWEFAERRPEFTQFYREMIRLRREHPALQQGETVWLENADPQRVLSYLRRDSKEQFFILINCSNEPARMKVTGVDVTGWRDVTPGATKAGTAELPAWGFRILQATK